MIVDLELDEEQQGDFTVVKVGGEIDVYTAPRLREKLNEVIDRDVRKVCVDLEGVQFLDSTGLGVLVGAMKKIRSHDEGELIIVCSRPHIRKVFEITGLTQVFNIQPALDTN